MMFGIQVVSGIQIVISVFARMRERTDLLLTCPTWLTTRKRCMKLGVGAIRTYLCMDLILKGLASDALQKGEGD